MDKMRRKFWPKFLVRNIKRSKAGQFSHLLWTITLLILALIILGEAFDVASSTMLPIDFKTDAEFFGEDNQTVNLIIVILNLFLPFAYGALGACAYLLRRCHQTIHQRTFDPLRQSEFMNRILLGFISGGAAGLILGESITGAVEQEIGQAALAFIAGYNTDFLFTAIERIIAAILPKVETQQSNDHPQNKTSDSNAKVMQ